MIRFSVLVSEVDGQISLDHCHVYYYQVQTQIFVCDVEYCDFCVCTFPGDEESATYIERIYRNDKFGKDYCLNYRVVGTHAPSCHPLSLTVTILIHKPSIQPGHLGTNLSALAAANQVDPYNHLVKYFSTVMAQRLVR